MFFFTTNNYKDCVLKAENLDNDTDTIATIAGGMTGLYYEYETIPKECISCIAKTDMLQDLCYKFYDSIKQQKP